MRLLSLLAAALLALPLAASAQSNAPRVTLAHDVNAERVDVMVDGELFTSYLYTDDLPVLKKPVLYPIRTADGRAITRGFPLDPTPGERVDHPHHIGLWFNYGDVNGLDFWNNSNAIKAEDAAKMGTITHREIKSMENGAGTAVLETASDWVNSAGEVLLREDTRYEFHALPGGARAIDRVTTLTAQGKPVSLKDNKEGVLGLRVTRALEHPATKPEVFTDASGRPTTVATLNNEGVTGLYRTSEGKEGDAAWGTRGRWNVLTGTLEGSPVAVAILDHPQNPGYPTYWHARGYGLFAANPLGQEALSGGKDKLNLSLDAGESTTFRHRIIVYASHPGAEKVEADFRSFTSAAQ